MTGTPILRTGTETQEEVKEVKEVKKQRQPSKSLSVKDKNKMCSILGFILYMKEQGKLSDEEARGMMEELPLFSTARAQIEFFEQEVFDLKKVEVELWKPMVVENRQNKKNKKIEKKNKKEEEVKAKEEEVKEKEPVKKEKKTRAKVADKKEVEGEEVKKRGRKQKKQIVEFNEEVTTINHVDPLDDLLNGMIEKPAELEPGEINENDLDDILKEMDMDAEKTEEVVVVVEAEKELVEEELKEDKKGKKGPGPKKAKKNTK
jgi:hypothetical protein